MDKEHARFILQSYRPDGADAHDQDFADALALAAENRELGEWLAHERAMDAAFAKALSTIELPDNLREDIIGCLKGEHTDFPEATDSHDAALIGALASVNPPASLRGEILATMEASTQQAKPEPTKVLPIWKNYKVALAAAAGIAMAFILTKPEPASQLTANGQLPADVVPASFIDTYKSPFFHLDFKEGDKKALVENLESRALPCPCCLPPGIENIPGLGCKELVIGGKRGSLICFKTDEAGVVHLVIFRRADVDGSFPTIEAPRLGTHGKWAVAKWQNTENVFMLIGESDTQQLAKLF